MSAHRAPLLIAAAALVLGALTAGCEDRQLGDLAEIRLQQLETADVLSHDGFDELPSTGGTWRGEVIASSEQPFTLESAVAVWKSSPPHRAILEHPRTHFGFATSTRPARSGRYYAVMIVEQR